MNDFTKEELIILKDALYGVLLDDSQERIIAHKIEYMIDNYCPHTGKKRDWECCKQCEDCGECVNTKLGKTV